MTRACSTDLRERVVAVVRSGATCRVVAERFGAAVSSVVKWSQLEARTGAVVPGRTGGHRKPVLTPHHDWLLARVQECPEVTLFALRDALRGRGVQVSHDMVWRSLRRAGLRFKKACWPVNRTGPMSPCVREVVCCSTFLYFSGGRDRTMIWDIHWNENRRF